MFEKVGSIQRRFSKQPINKNGHASRSAPKQARSHRAPRTPLAQPNPVSQLVTLFGLFAALFGTVAPSNAQPIDPATARDSFSGGGLTISAADLQRIAVGLPPRDVHLVNYEWPTTAAAITPSSPLPSDVSAGAVALRPTDATFGNGARRARDKSVLPDDELPTHQLVHQKSPESTSTTHALGSSPTMPPLPPTSTPRGGSGRVLLVECNGAFGYATIQLAIDDAVDGDIVVVLPNDCTPEGRWFENINFLGKAIRVQSANPQDEAIVEATVIDGNANGTVVTFENGEGLDSVLDGVVVTNGFATTNDGGGFNLLGTGPTIRNSKVIQNHSDFTGGAMRVSSGAIGRFEHCVFDGNSTATGFSVFDARQSAIPSFIDCVFRNHGGNSMGIGNPGTGLECDERNACTEISGCLFENNTAKSGFGGNYLQVSNCTFRYNSAAGIGGQFCEFSDCTFEDNEDCAIGTLEGNVSNCSFRRNGPISGSLVYMRNSGDIVNCVFESNQSEFAIIEYHPVTPFETKIVGCEFRSNSSRIATIYGPNARNLKIHDSAFIGNHAVIYTAGAFMNSALADAEIINSVFVANTCDNTIGRGGSAVFSLGDLPITSSIFVGNVSYNGIPAIVGVTASNGGKPFVSNSTIIGNASNGPTGGVENVKLENCIVYNNRGAGGVEDQTAQLAPGTVANYCNIQNFTELLTVQAEPMASVGNFDLDPNFVDPGEWDDMGTPADLSDDVFIPGDYHLLPDSPCIDAGDPEFIPDENATDIDGESRVQSCRVDIGADEFAQDDIAVPGDFDGDGFVSLADVPEFLSVALGPVGSQVCLGDLTGDGRFDGRDIAALTALLIGN